MLSFQNISLRRKQMLIIMLTSTVALLLACASFVAFDVSKFRQEMVQSTSSLAEVVGNSMTAAIDFDDTATATQLLMALRGEPNVVLAQVHTQDGRTFASYIRDSAPPPPKLPHSLEVRHEFTARHLHLFRSITQSGERIGTIELVVNLDELPARLWRYAGIAILVLTVSLLAAFWISIHLQKLISDPILDLATLARSVAVDKNYSVRATKNGNDELGQLVDGFNGMLAQIQQRDAALETARANLENRVAERTMELSYERHLLQALLDNSLDHIYFKDTRSRFIKSTPLDGTSPEAMVGKTDFDFFTEAHARPAFEDEQEIIRTGQPLIGKIEKEILKDGRESWVLTNKMPLRDKDDAIIGTFGISKDITAIKAAEAKLEKMHTKLLDASRQAGMAEVATNVLHNVGNVLNSVNISTDVIVESVKKSRACDLARVVALLQEHAHDLGDFITNDPKGKHVPAHLARLSEHLLADQTAIIGELDSLRHNIEHIKEIVAMQQNYATVGGVKEMISVVSLVEDSLRMNEGAMSRHHVEVIREFETVPLMNVEKHKILQILVNLLKNAKHACDESGHDENRVTVRVTCGEGKARISVTDNGVGIPRENLARIFSHGFTTRKTGHGFGLHSGALAAREIGGALTVHSDGPGQGATFVLELPLPPVALPTDGGQHTLDGMLASELSTNFIP